MPELQLVAGERVLGSFENFLFLARMEPLKYFLTIWTLWHVFQADACGLHFGNASVPAGVGAAWETDSCFFFFCPHFQWFQSRSSSPCIDKHHPLIWTLLLPVEELLFTWWREEAEWIQVPSETVHRHLQFLPFLCTGYFPLCVRIK